MLPNGLKLRFSRNLTQKSIYLSYVLTMHILFRLGWQIPQKCFLNIFNPFFSKNIKNHVFSLFYPKIRHFSKRHFRFIFSLNILKKYKFEEFLHILSICALKRVKIAISGRFNPKMTSSTISVFDRFWSKCHFVLM